MFDLGHFCMYKDYAGNDIGNFYPDLFSMLAFWDLDEFGDTFVGFNLSSAYFPANAYAMLHNISF